MTESGLRIAFGGKMGSGKDTAVDYLISKYNNKKQSSHKLSFACPIYNILYHAQSICGFKREKDRKFLQWIGTEWAKSRDSNVWINILLKNANSYPSSDNKLLSDLRFPDEFKALKNNGWKCIHIIRPMDTQVGTTDMDTHISETSLEDIPKDEWDYIVINDGTLEDLYKKLNEIKFLNIN